MSFNSTDISTCNDEPIVQSFMFFLDNIETPVYFIVGLFSRLISLFSIYQETKTEKAYLFQVYLILAELFEILFQFVSQMTWKLTTIPSFRRSYVCMFWYTHFNDVFSAATKSITNILTLAMTSDRVYALREPIKYNTNQSVAKIRKWLPFFAILITFAITIPFGLIFELAWDPNIEEYVQVVTRSDLGLTYSMYSGFIDLVLTISNIVANVVLCYAFRKVMRQRAKIKQSSSNSTTAATTDDQSKTLFTMTFCQSFCNTFASLISIIHRITVPLMGVFAIAIFRMAYCLGGQIVALVTELMNIVEFFLMLVVSKKFRAMVIGTMKKMWCVKVGENRVRSIQVS